MDIDQEEALDEALDSRSSIELKEPHSFLRPQESKSDFSMLFGSEYDIKYFIRMLQSAMDLDRIFFAVIDCVALPVITAIEKEQCQEIKIADSGIELVPGCAYIIPRHLALARQENAWVFERVLNTSISQQYHELFYVIQKIEFLDLQQVVFLKSAVWLIPGLPEKILQHPAALYMEYSSGMSESHPDKLVALNRDSISKVLTSKTAQTSQEMGELVSNTDLAEVTPDIDFLELLTDKTGVDFNQYSRVLIAKHLRNRMLVLGLDTSHRYMQFCQSNIDEYGILKRNITESHPRPQSFFNVLSYAQPLDSIVKNWLNSKYQSLRCWVPGCGYGEEAYGLAVLLEQLKSCVDTSVDYKVFATDIDGDAIEQASKGLSFSPHDYEAKEVSPDIRDLLESLEVNVAVNYGMPKLRRRIFFSIHNLLKDAPLANLNIIVCRSTLPLFIETTKRKIIQLFYNSLMEDGLLILTGLDDFDFNSAGFKAIDSMPGLYRKNKTTSSLKVQDANRSDARAQKFRVPSLYSLLQHHKKRNLYKNYKVVFGSLVEQYVPPGFLVDTDLNLVHAFSDLTPFIENMTSGKVQANIKQLLTADLKPVVINLLRRLEALVGEKDSLQERVRITLNQKSTNLMVTTRRFLEAECDEVYYAVFFEEEPADSGGPRMSDNGFLDEQLQYTKLVEDDLDAFKLQAKESFAHYENQISTLSRKNTELLEAIAQLQSSNERSVNFDDYFFDIYQRAQKKLNWMEGLNNQLVTAISVFDENLQLEYYNYAMTHVFPFTDTDKGCSLELVELGDCAKDLIADMRKVLASKRPLQRQLNQDSLAFIQSFSQKHVMLSVVAVHSSSEKEIKNTEIEESVLELQSLIDGYN